MKFLRSVESYSLLDKMSEVTREELEIYNLNDKIQQYTNQ
jgi:hypothetical protein